MEVSSVSAVGGSSGERRESVRALERGLGVLQYLAGPNAARGVSLTELSRDCGLHKSTAHRLLDTMKQLGFVRQDTDNERYLLGYMVLTVAAQLLTGVDLREIASSVLWDLAAETGHTVHLATWDRGHVMYIDKVETGDWVRSTTNVGMRNPAHCTGSGKAMLAYLPEVALQETLAKGLPSFSPYTITSEADLRSALCEVRSRGYAVDDREIYDNTRGVAAPIFDYRGRVAGALSIGSPATVLSLERAEALAPRIVEAANSISRRLGYQV